MRGHCLCGAVRFEIDGPYPALYQCHCSLCRKQGGSASNTGMIVAPGKFRWLQGAGEISTYELPTGFRSHFCATCGSTVPNPLRDTGYMWVPAGLLEGGEGLEVRVHIFTGSRAAWDRADLPGRLHEAMPEMTEFIAALHAK